MSHRQRAEALIGQSIRYVSPSWTGNVTTPNRVTVGLVVGIPAAAGDIGVTVPRADGSFDRSPAADMLRRGGPDRWAVALLDTGDLVPVEGA